MRIVHGHPNSLTRNPRDGEDDPLEHDRRRPGCHPHPTAPRKAVTLQFGDNALLPLLFGDHDRNLVRLEQGLNVRMSSRGNRVAITGEPDRVQAAEQALNGLYKRLETGKGVSRADVDTAIRMADQADRR